MYEAPWTGPGLVEWGENSAPSTRTFPTEWGRPPGDLRNRADWILQHATRASRHNSVTRNGMTGAAALRSLQRRASPPSATLTGEQAMVNLERRMRRERAAMTTRMRLRAESGDSRG